MAARTDVFHLRRSTSHGSRPNSDGSAGSDQQETFRIMPDGRKKGQFPRFSAEVSPQRRTFVPTEIHALPAARARREGLITRSEGTVCSRLTVTGNRRGCPRTDLRIEIGGIADDLIDHLPPRRRKLHRKPRTVFPPDPAAPTVYEAVAEALKHPGRHIVLPPVRWEKRRVRQQQLYAESHPTDESTHDQPHTREATSVTASRLLHPSPTPGAAARGSPASGSRQVVPLPPLLGLVAGRPQGDSSRPDDGSRGAAAASSSAGRARSDRVTPPPRAATSLN